MRKLIVKTMLLSALSVPLLADFFPPTVEQTVTSINGKNIMLDAPLPATGMSGVAIHKYGTVQAATVPVVQIDNSGMLTVVDASIIEKSKLPAIATKVMVGDKVVGGYLYNNVLLLAPNETAYNDFRAKYKKEWIHPDLFAVYLARKGDSATNADNLESFAREYQVGLIAIVMKDSVVLYDPISRKTVAKQTNTMADTNTNAPFFTKLNTKAKGFFGGESKVDYFETMAKIK